MAVHRDTDRDTDKAAPLEAAVAAANSAAVAAANSAAAVVAFPEVAAAAANSAAVVAFPEVAAAAANLAAAVVAFLEVAVAAFQEPADQEPAAAPREAGVAAAIAQVVVAASPEAVALPGQTSRAAPRTPTNPMQMPLIPASPSFVPISRPSRLHPNQSPIIPWILKQWFDFFWCTLFFCCVESSPPAKPNDCMRLAPICHDERSRHGKMGSVQYRQHMRHLTTN